MGRSNRKHHRATTKSHTLPSSPTHSSSSSSFEFTISHSPHKSSAAADADDLFYKGQLLPLHLSPRLRTLLSSPSSSDTTASRDSTASLSSSDSSRPSSVTHDELKRLHPTTNNDDNNNNNNSNSFHSRKSQKYFSLPKFSSVFRKTEDKSTAPSGGGAAVKRGAKEVLRKYLNKMKPLYDRLSHKRPAAPPPPSSRSAVVAKNRDHELNSTKNFPQSFSGNLRCSRRRSYVASCPSSMTSSPGHGESGFGPKQMGWVGSSLQNSEASSMEELQSAIQGAIAHCKNSMIKNRNIYVE